MEEPLVRVENLVKYFPVFERGILMKKKVGDVHAVDDMSISIGRAQTVGLVGESGCGKTTAGKVILELIPSDSGEIYFEGKPVHQTLEKGTQE